jgi:SAM-dependent methyltransferase
MAGEPRFRSDLFVGTARYYDEFRPPYPPALLDELSARVPLGSTSRVLDLACGTGQLAFPLAGRAGEVWAIDQEPESVEFGRQKAARLAVTNLRWRVGRAEEVALDGRFDLVTIGNAFHRLDRDAVARRLVDHLARRGCVALVWSSSPWLGDAPWERALHDALQRWQDEVGARDRIPAGWEEARQRDPDEQVFRRAGLVPEWKYELAVEHRWTVDSLVGFVWSTSFLNRVALGDRADEFAADLRRVLLACCPDDRFEHELTFDVELARVP